MKYLLFILFTVFSIQVRSQEDKTVTLVVSGQGKTTDESRQKALRNAIEQAFGTFISSNTDILNDELINDDIVSISNGNIQKFEIISEVEIPGEGYATSLKATVSVTKLTSFVEGKGVEVEFKGSLFAFNIKQQILNEKNEAKAIEDLSTVLIQIANLSFDYTLNPSDPVAVDTNNEKWRIPLRISVTANKNILSFAEYMHTTLKGMSLSIDEASNYVKLGKSVYPVSIAANNSKSSYVLLRNEQSISKLMAVIYHFNAAIQNFKISNGIESWAINEKSEFLKGIEDARFKIFLRIGNNGGDWHGYNKNSVFFTGGGSYKSKKIILDVENWYETATIWNGNFYENITGLVSKDFLLSYDKAVNTYKADPQFSFISKFSREVQNNLAGLVISFIGVESGAKLIEFQFEDIRSLEEIDKISEYKISSTIQ